jgi:hypothetical protein
LANFLHIIIKLKIMKKLTLVVAVVLLTSAATFAQFNLGLKAGLNYATISAKDNQFNEDGVLGYQTGIWARVGKVFYVQPEVYLGTKSSDFTFTTVGNLTVQENQKFTTLDVPVLLGTKIGTNKFNARLMAGPSFQFLLDDNNSAFSQAVDPSFYKYKDFITNLQAGVGIDLGNISVDLRYETSLQDINDNDGQKQNLLHLSLGFKLL